jgi:hypothetical protein
MKAKEGGDLVRREREPVPGALSNPGDEAFPVGLRWLLAGSIFLALAAAAPSTGRRPPDAKAGVGRAANSPA